ncbi:MAG: hypothetical protein ACHQRM_14305 [Bacteroidia bacterium]
MAHSCTVKSIEFRYICPMLRPYFCWFRSFILFTLCLLVTHCVTAQKKEHVLKLNLYIDLVAHLSPGEIPDSLSETVSINILRNKEMYKELSAPVRTRVVGVGRLNKKTARKGTLVYLALNSEFDIKLSARNADTLILHVSTVVPEEAGKTDMFMEQICRLNKRTPSEMTETNVESMSYDIPNATFHTAAVYLEPEDRARAHADSVVLNRCKAWVGINYQDAINVNWISTDDLFICEFNENEGTTGRVSQDGHTSILFYRTGAHTGKWYQTMKSAYSPEAIGTMVSPEALVKIKAELKKEKDKVRSITRVRCAEKCIARRIPGARPGQTEEAYSSEGFYVVGDKSKADFTYQFTSDGERIPEPL